MPRINATFVQIRDGDTRYSVVKDGLMAHKEMYAIARAIGQQAMPVSVSADFWCERCMSWQKSILVEYGDGSISVLCPECGNTYKE